MEDKELAERLETRNKAYIEFLQELNRDRKKDSIFLKIIVAVLVLIVVISISGIVFISMRTQDKIEAMAEKSEKRMYEFISQYDFDTTYNLDSLLNDNNSGNINVTRK